MRGKCTKDASACSADGTSLIDVAGNASSCGAYKCVGTACLTACKTTDDCVAGLVCDDTTSSCATPTTPAVSSGGGCTTAPGRAKVAGLGAWVAAALAALASRRRARGRRARRDVDGAARTAQGSRGAR